MLFDGTSAVEMYILLNSARQHVNMEALFENLRYDAISFSCHADFKQHFQMLQKLNVNLMLFFWLNKSLFLQQKGESLKTI